MAEDESGLEDQLKKLKVKNDINILLLGETGVGKSTFINAIATYLTNSSDFEDAEAKKGLDVLVPSVITIEDKRGKMHKLTVGKKDENETLIVGESATQDVKTYVFPIWNNQVKIRLIDTPGMGDTRGLDQDNINSENILSYISNLEELHAICFLFRPDRSRNTIFFQYCIAQIFSRLDKSACDNIIFVFSGTRGTNYGPGDTMDILRRTVQEIHQRPPHVKIQLARNVFCFENESFKYLAATKEKIEFSKETREKNKESWKKSSSECWRLINYIVGDRRNKPLQPHLVKNTTAINEARRMITHLAQPLADISELIHENINILQRRESELQMENLSLEDLKKKLYMPVINLEVITQSQPVTVCSSRICAEIYKVGDVNKWHYKQRCHDPCYLTNVPKEIIGSPELVNCAAIDRSTRRCIKCTCDFSIHMHIYYMTKTKEDKQKDGNVEKNINTKEKALATKRILINQIRVKRDELDTEHKTVVGTCAKFAHFLQNNAITPFNDSYKDYIEYLINREKSLGGLCNSGTVRHLERLLREYEEAKSLFDQANRQSNDFTVTPQDIWKSVETLYQLKHMGNKIEEMSKCQNKARSKEFKNTEYVHKGIPMKTEKKDIKRDSNKDSKKGSDKEGSRSRARSEKRSDNRNQTSSQPRRNFQQRDRDSDPPFRQHQYNQQYTQPHIPPLMNLPPTIPPTMPQWNMQERTAPPPREQEYPGYNINIKYTPNNTPQNESHDAYNHASQGSQQFYDKYQQPPSYYESTAYGNQYGAGAPGTGYYGHGAQSGHYDPSYYGSGMHGHGYYGAGAQGHGSYGSGTGYYHSGMQGSRPYSSRGTDEPPHYGQYGSGNRHPAQSHRNSGPHHADNRQYRGSGRNSGNGRSGNRGDQGDRRHGGRGGGIGKNYRSQNMKKKNKKDETDSDSSSSASSDGSDSS